MNDSEIIKALECCYILHRCESCPCDFDTNGKTLCNDLGLKIFDLINRQKVEIERLKNHFVYGKVHNHIAIEIGAEHAIIEAIKPQIIREFAEKLKRKSELLAPSVYAEPYRAVSTDDIDNLVKEMREVGNGDNP